MLRSSTSRHIAFCAGVLFALTPTIAAFGQGAARTAPVPPARPSVAPPQAPPPQPARPAVPNDDADLDPDRPPVLPQASRAKMHACGREWQDMKRRGADRDVTWRQFATICLQRG